ncbi:MAG: hypothetical protein DRH50_14705 [Deltaproteobacteria bacterium]|nr:MAG: hypothetical protein DRH50_14705 [Deltaproteobacteria bacterium]
MFIFSYSPFICMFIFVGFVLALLLMAILDQSCILEINMRKCLNTYFEPLLFALFILTITVSVLLAVFYWIDINNNEKIDASEKKKWKKLFVKISLFANAFYYDYKYNNDEPQYLFENILRKSRNKMFGHVEIPKV